MPYFNSLLEYWLLGTIFFYHKDVINIQLVHNLFTHSKTLADQQFYIDKLITQAEEFFQSHPLDKLYGFRNS